MTASAQPEPVPPLAAPAVVPLTLTAPPSLHVGEQTELVVAVGANSAVGEVRFTLRFDPNVLQVRAGAPGAWATGEGQDTRFSAEIPEAADRVQIRTAPAGARASAAGGTVALVHFQAVGPGTTAVAITDMTVTDRGGRAMPIALSTSRVQVTAEDTPPPQAVHEHPPR